MSDRLWTDNHTLGEAREWISREVMHGVSCPLCTQFAKIYKRPIESGMAFGLIEMYLSRGREPFHTAFLAMVRGPAKLRYWDLVAEDDEKGTGWWHITDLGESFIRGTARVQKYALIYDAHFIGLDGPLVTIQECLGNKFDRAELLGRAGVMSIESLKGRDDA
jgi:hypothetical protein